ncbi:hypothetical protein LTR64_008780 [Lithohypha guttulata]|uniref:uncharacterized protein n=1 Tax=Lithohypha guttulata TaxID=1690604 RepID=UPI00315D67F4
MTADGAPDVWIEEVETPDVHFNARQMESSSACWVENRSLGRSGGNKPKVRRLSEALAPVVEFEEREDEEEFGLGQYIYYGV